MKKTKKTVLELKIADYAKRIGVAKSTVYRQIEKGSLPEGVSHKEVAGYPIIVVSEDQLPSI